MKPSLAHSHSEQRDAWAAHQQHSSDQQDNKLGHNRVVVCKGDNDWRSDDDKEQSKTAHFSWWITLLCAAACFAGYIAWMVLMISARDTTNAAIDGYGINVGQWGSAVSMLTALAVVYPCLVVVGLGVSFWRWALARRLDLNRPDARMAAQNRRFQATNAVSSFLLWVLLGWLVASGAVLGGWAVAAQTATFGSKAALKYVDPVWSGLTDILNSTSGVVNTVQRFADGLPAIGRRRALLAADILGIDHALVLAALEKGPQAASFDPTLPEPAHAADSSEVAAHAAAGSETHAHAADGSEVRAVRKLQQAAQLPSFDGLLQGIGNFVQSVGNVTRQVASAAAPMLGNVTSVIGSVTNATANIPVIGNITRAAAPLAAALPSLLPNGTSNPLFNALDDVVNTVTAVVNGSTTTGCPIYCINLANSTWIQGNPCICNLDRVRRGVEPASGIASKVLQAFVALMFMYAGCAWLLMHGTSQWARSRTEAKAMSQKMQPVAEGVADRAEEGMAHPGAGAGMV